MTPQINWQKIRNEFNRLSDVENLKSEVQRIGTEIRKFDFHTVLSPAAAAKVKAFEKRYATLMRTISQGQRQMDREFNRILREIKGRRAVVNKMVREQKNKLEKVSTDLRKRWAKSPARKAAASGRVKARTTASRVRKAAKKTTRKKA